MTNIVLAPIILCGQCDHEFPARTTEIPDFDNGVSFFTSAVDSAELDEDIERYDEEIERVKDVLNDLRWQRAVLKQHRNGCKRALSAVRRVPVEIWSEILSLVCLENELDERQNPAIELAMVCRQWRALVLSSPALWVYFVIDLREGHHTDENLVFNHFKFSQPLPVKIRFWFPTIQDLCLDCVNCDRKWAQSYFALRETPCTTVFLVDLARRIPFDGWWKRISHIRFTSRHAPMMSWFSLLVKAFAQSGATFEALESLEIGSNSGQKETFDLTPLKSATKLRHLLLSNYFGGPLPFVAWSQLQTVDLEVDPGVAVRLLTRCPNITSAKLVLSGIPYTGEPCVAQNLQCLIIEAHTTASKSFWPWSWLTAPSLQSLNIETTTWQRFDATSLFGFLKSSPLLQNLIVQTINSFNHIEWIPILSMLPQIRLLQLTNFVDLLDDGGVSQFLLQHLVMSSNRPTILPKLDNLRIACLDDSLETLLDVVESRRPVIRTVTVEEGELDWPKCFPMGFMERVEMLRETGVKVTLPE
ncbi:hypothetical protein C8J56DRAFT_962488 [Mycena floridula]|nr:hypothetical protein C8J56DRAFT_962488 [Mycena floridula]